MSLPKVTIGIPTYSRAPRLARSLKSAQAQDYPELEILISDNASPDGTEELCRTAAAADPRIRYLRQAKNIGSTANFNAVLAAASGDYFLWLADDDWLTPNYVSACMALLRADPAMALVAGRVEFPDETAENMRYPKPRKYLQDEPQARVLDYLWNARDNSINCGIYPRKLLAQVGMKNTLAGDWLTVAEIAGIGKMAVITDATVYRSIGGASRNHKYTVKSLGLPLWQQYAPKLAIALNLSRYFFQEYPFNNLDAATRRQLSIRIFLLLAARKRIFRWLLLFVPRHLHPARDGWSRVQ